MNYVEHLNIFGVEAKEIPCIKGNGEPTIATIGAVGCLYMDTLNGEIYKCTAVENGIYTWNNLSSGKSTVHKGAWINSLPEREEADYNGIFQHIEVKMDYNIFDEKVDIFTEETYQYKVGDFYYNTEEERLFVCLSVRIEIDDTTVPNSSTAYTVWKDLNFNLAEIVNIPDNPVQQVISGNPIIVSDVSPVSHNLDVKVSAENETDLSTVKVSRYGKNLINQAELCKAYEEIESGVYKSNFSNIAVNATNKIHIPLKDYIGKTLVFSFKGKVSANQIQPYAEINGINIKGNVITSIDDFTQSCVAFIPQTVDDYVGITYGSGGGNIATIKDLQLEFGATPTDYEVYDCQTATANTDGTVKSLTSVSPIMILVADNADVNIEVGYNLNFNSYAFKKLNTNTNSILNLENGTDQLKGMFSLGSIVNGETYPQSYWQVSTVDFIKYDRPITLSVADGYKIRLHLQYTDDKTLLTLSGWITDSFIVDKNLPFKIQIARTDDDTNHTAGDIDEYVNAITIKSELFSRVEDLENKEKEELTPNDTYFANGLIRQCYNPYKDGGSMQLTGQLHCHSVKSVSGDTITYYATPDEMCAAYRDAGYDFMTLTDYSHLGQIFSPETVPEGLIYLCNSAEVSIPSDNAGNKIKHLCVFNTNVPYKFNKYLTLEEFADIAKEKGSIVSFAHPMWTDTYYPPEKIERIMSNGVRFCEVYNGLTIANQEAQAPTGKGYDFAWETMLDNGFVTWGICVSDSHGTGNILKMGCVKVFADTKDRLSILQNLCKGNFVGCSNSDKSINSVSFNDGTITINTGDSSATTVFMKEYGEILKTTTGEVATYTMNGTEKYVRAVVTLADGSCVWVQPIVNLFKQNINDCF